MRKQKFIRDVANQIRKDPWHQLRRKRRTGGQAIGWPERLHCYCWATTSRPDLFNHLVWLEQVRNRALRAESLKNSRARRSGRCMVARDILHWGGVTRDNLPKVPNVTDAVVHTARSGFSTTKAPMNSGWTKIAAVYSTVSSAAPPPNPHRPRAFGGKGAKGMRKQTLSVPSSGHHPIALQFYLSLRAFVLSVSP